VVESVLTTIGKRARKEKESIFSMKACSMIDIPYQVIKIMLESKQEEFQEGFHI